MRSAPSGKLHIYFAKRALGKPRRYFTFFVYIRQKCFSYIFLTAMTISEQKKVSKGVPRN